LTGAYKYSTREDFPFYFRIPSRQLNPLRRAQLSKMLVSVLTQLWTLAAASLAYNCTPYNFPMNDIGLPGQCMSTADIADKIVDANPEGMGSAHVWVNPVALPLERDENNLFTNHYCFARDFNCEKIGHTVNDAIKLCQRRLAKLVRTPAMLLR
jgi:uncharacterized protein YfaP (DUF2135 family)